MESKQSYTIAAADTDGIGDGVTGAAFTLTAEGAGDGLAHHVTILNNTATDHSGKTIALIGKDADGNAITETLTGPEGSATVTSAKAFKELTSATPSATIGADTFDIGWAATGNTPWVDLNPNIAAFNASVAAIAGGTIDFDIQHTYEEPAADVTAFVATAFDGKTATVEGAFTSPIRAVRGVINSHTSGTLTLIVRQGERY